MVFRLHEKIYIKSNYGWIHIVPWQKPIGNIVKTNYLN